MRALLVLSFVVAIGGCATTRHVLGLNRQPANQADVPADAANRTAKSRTSRVKPLDQNLPTGLGGDKEHKAYSGTAPN